MEKLESSHVAFGSAIKALGDNKIGGYLVRFSGPKDPDLVGDFFTKDTDFGPHLDHDIGLYYGHGFDPMMKARIVGMGKVTPDDAGLWFEAQLEARDDYDKYIAELIDAGKLSYSSGAVMVDREQKGNGSYEIKSWVLSEASLTPTPAEPRNLVMPVKAIKDGLFINRENLIPEAEQPEDARKASAPAVKNVPEHSQEKMKENENKEPEVKEAKAPEATVDVSAIVKGAVDEAVKSLTEQFAASQDTTSGQDVKAEILVKPASPGVLIPKTELGDSQTKAVAHWLKTGDTGAVKSMLGGDELGREVIEIKASNATDMNVGTAADGGNTVTDDMHGKIVRRRDEVDITKKVGVTRFTANGTTLDVPTDNEADSEFVSTAEAGTFDEDAPAIGQLVLTKVKYTKRTKFSYELLQDTSADIMNFVTDRVGIGMGKTFNDLFNTEVAANGSEFKVLAGTAAVAVDEPEDIALNSTNAFYSQSPERCSWVMAPATYNAISKLDDASIRRYANNQQGEWARSILGSPVYLSGKVDALGSGLKPILFGDFSYVAQLLDPTIQFLRDPYSLAASGQIQLYWYFRTDFGTSQAAAVGYARNITT